MFGIPYFYTCLVPKNESREEFIFDGVCIYGGVTMHSTADSISKNIIVPVTVDNKQQFSFTISTNKKTVTVQELDYKVRNWLTNNKNYMNLMGRHMRRVISNLLKKIKIVFGTICFLKGFGSLYTL